jgi:nitrous oxide reductase accessory protein NosL
MFLAPVLMLLAGMAAGAQEDIEEHRSCVHCGMDRKAYGYSRMLIRYEDGSAIGLCSLHCAVLGLEASKNRSVKSIQVADRDTHALLEADKAVWVMGGGKRGVMTQRPKWAFATLQAAALFIKEHGGILVSWAEAQAAAREDAVRKNDRHQFSNERKLLDRK